MEQLDDLAARHATHLYRYGSYTANQIKKITDKIDSKLSLEVFDLIDSMSQRDINDFIAGRYTTAKSKRLSESIKTASIEVRQAVSTIVGKNGKDLVGYELTRTEKVISAIPALSYLLDKYKGISEASVYKKVAATPIKGAHMKTMNADISTRFQKSLYSQVRDGMSSGENSADILKRLRGTTAQLKKDGVYFRRDTDVEAFARTSMTHISAQSNEAAYAEMGVEKIVYRATLDGRTSSICASLDGSVWPVHEGPRPPQHINCRSEIIPYHKDMDWTRPSVADKRPMGKIPKKERGDKVKSVPASQNYKEWFESKSKTEEGRAYQKEWLGESRYKLYKAGVTFDRFTDPAGKRYDLKTMAVRDAQAFKDAGLKLRK